MLDQQDCHGTGGQYVEIDGGDGAYAQLDKTGVHTYSQEREKKDFEDFKNGLDVVKNTNVYKYYFKGEDNNINKHIGFVIPDNGGNYKLDKEVLSEDKKTIDNYKTLTILWEAVKEQQEIIEKQQKEIDEIKEEIKSLKGGKNQDLARQRKNRPYKKKVY